MAQLVAHSLWERGVASSSLAAPTTIKKEYLMIKTVLIITFFISLPISIFSMNEDDVSKQINRISIEEQIDNGCSYYFWTGLNTLSLIPSYVYKETKKFANDTAFQIELLNKAFSAPNPTYPLSSNRPQKLKSE